MNVKKFIDRYEWAYFSEEDMKHSKKDFQAIGLKTLNTTAHEVEDYFFVNDTKWK